MRISACAPQVVVRFVTPSAASGSCRGQYARHCAILLPDETRSSRLGPLERMAALEPSASAVTHLHAPPDIKSVRQNPFTHAARCGFRHRASDRRATGYREIVHGQSCGQYTDGQFCSSTSLMALLRAEPGRRQSVDPFLSRLCSAGWNQRGGVNHADFYSST